MPADLVAAVRGRARPGRAGPVLSLAVLSLAALLLPALPGSAAAAPGRPAGPPVALVVQVAPGSEAGVERTVVALGGQVRRRLPLVDALAVTVPAAGVGALGRTPGAGTLTPDSALQVRGTTTTDPAPTGTDPSAEHPVAPDVVRAPEAWAAGVTGAGVTVALLDTGIADSPDLAGRVVPVRSAPLAPPQRCYDLSGEGTCDDTFGHGTFMAGLIAGDGSASGGVRTGIAPDARLVSVKVAGASGAADVSTVLAGIQWVVSFKDTYGIRVLNLSLGTDSTASWRSDPLNFAVERAWAAGITVVVAAANNGPAAGTVDKPGDDPWVVTVGATDSRGTPGLGDDQVPDFSSRGPTTEGVAKPDLVAPGGRVLSLRAPGSTVQRTYPSLLPGRYRHGSGTSMATAVVSGAAALALQAHPELTPDRLKHALVAAARPDASDDPAEVGAGLVDAASTALRPADGVANIGLDRSTGTGSIAASRGTVHVQVDGVVPTVLTTRQTAQLLLWDPLGFVSPRWTPATWYTSLNALAGWNTASWVAPLAGQDWVGQDWVGQDWVGSSWQSGSSPDTSYGRHGPGSASYGAWD